jgi:uncharacterized membrane protein SpoIIM required for sporulation
MDFIPGKDDPVNPLKAFLGWIIIFVVFGIPAIAATSVVGLIVAAFVKATWDAFVAAA